MPVQRVKYYVRITTFRKTYSVGQGYSDLITAKAVMRNALANCSDSWADGEVWHNTGNGSVIDATGQKRTQSPRNYMQKLVRR